MVSTEPNAKNQHYVWQHYLNAWAAEGGAAVLPEDFFR